MVQHAKRQEERIQAIEEPRSDDEQRPTTLAFDDLDEATRKAFDWAWAKSEAALRYLADR